jgi:hypothetical protein
MQVKTSAYLFFIIVFIILSPLSASAQEPPVRWGEIPKSDLEMKSFPQDTNASAVILCDYGISKFNNELDMVYTAYIRIKILTVKGYSWASRAVEYRSEDDAERIKNIEGATYNSNADGTTSKTELRKEDIFTEKIDKRYSRVKFTLPALTPGCVIEMRYTIIGGGAVRSWRFQCDEPVRWSEYVFRFPKCFSYAALHQGSFPYAIREMIDTAQVFSGYATEFFSNSTVPCTQMRFAAANIPALRSEPFFTTRSDYIKKVGFQLTGYPYIFGSKHIVSWQNLIKDYLEGFNESIEVTRQIRNRADEITRGLSTPEEKLKAIYNWVKKSIVYSEWGNRNTSQSVDEVLESKKGTGTEITFLLLSLLRRADIAAEPILASTRENGTVNTSFPLETQFDYVLARARIDSQYCYVDATDPLRPLGLLSEKLLNTRGLVMREDSVEWVNFSSPKSAATTSFAQIRLGSDGTLQGTLEDAYQDYDELAVREYMVDKKDADIARNQFGTEPLGITVDSVHIDGKDSLTLPLRLKAWISSPDYVQQNGDLIYLNPSVFHRMTDNPLKSPVREFPIDYIYKRKKIVIIHITLPDSFEVKTPLLDRTLIVGQNLILFTRKVATQDNAIQIQYKFEVRNAEIQPEYYERLRDLYAQMITIQSESLVLVHKKPFAKPAAGGSKTNKPIPSKGVK